MLYTQTKVENGSSKRQTCAQLLEMRAATLVSASASRAFPDPCMWRGQDRSHGVSKVKTPSTDTTRLLLARLLLESDMHSRAIHRKVDKNLYLE